MGLKRKNARADCILTRAGRVPNLRSQSRHNHSVGIDGGIRQ